MPNDTQTSAWRTLEQAKAACERGAPQYPPVRHIAVVKDLDGVMPPWEVLCYPHKPVEQAPVITNLPSVGHWPGHYFTDTDNLNHSTRGALRKFEALAETIVQALKDARLGTFAIARPGITHETGGLAAGRWLNEIYERAWAHHSPLLKAPRYRLHQVMSDTTAAIRIEHLSDDEWAARLGLSAAMAAQLRPQMEIRLNHDVGEKLFAHEYYSVLCDGADDVFSASAWAIDALLSTESKAVRPKRSTQPGDAREKIIAGLAKHHKYGDDSSLNLEPIQVNEFARELIVSSSSVSKFFKDKFGGYDKYRAICRDANRLVGSLKLLLGEFSPHHLYGRTPPGEGNRDDEE